MFLFDSVIFLTNQMSEFVFLVFFFSMFDSLQHFHTYEAIYFRLNIVKVIFNHLKKYQFHIIMLHNNLQLTISLFHSIRKTNALAYSDISEQLSF